MLSEIEETSDDEVLSQGSVEHVSPAQSVHSHSSKRKSCSNLTNEQIIKLEKLRLQAEVDNKRLDAEIG